MPVAVVTPDGAEELLAVLCDAFFDYPVMRYVLGGEPDYPTRLRKLVHLFVAARRSPWGLLLGAYDSTGAMAGAAVLDLPDEQALPPSFEQLREATWAELGREAQARYTAYSAASHEFEHGAHHHHLGMIGVRATEQGSGLGRALLEHVHALAEANPGSAGVSLTTELPRNVELYRYFGYNLTGHTRVAPELETWSFFRPSIAEPRAGSRVRRAEIEMERRPS